MTKEKNGSLLRWTTISIYFFLTIFSAFWHGPTAVIVLPVLLVFTMFIAVCLHGKVRYGVKNLLVFFLITWLISHFFEALSIQTGFPFGHYFYHQLAGPRLFEVPLIIMFAYFGTGYASWILANILLKKYSEHLSGRFIFLVPFIAAFIMVMWDLCMDPLSSTVYSLWVWKDGGGYFGVPLQNYFGWFLVVFIIYQLFALYLWAFDTRSTKTATVLHSKSFWLQAVAIYGIQALTQLVDSFGASSHAEIYTSMALVTVFTMIFVSLLAMITVINAKKDDF